MLSGVQLLDFYKEMVESRWTVAHEKALAVPWKHGDIGGTSEQRYDIFIYNMEYIRKCTSATL